MHSRLFAPSGHVNYVQNHSCNIHTLSVQCIAVASAQPQHNRAAAQRAAVVPGSTAADPPDVVPDVLLLLQSDIQQYTQSEFGSSDPANSMDNGLGEQQQLDQVQQQKQQQQQESMLIPKTSSRLRGLGQLPGFIPSLALQPDPHLVVRQQEVSLRLCSVRRNLCFIQQYWWHQRAMVP